MKLAALRNVRKETPTYLIAESLRKLINFFPRRPWIRSDKIIKAPLEIRILKEILKTSKGVLIHLRSDAVV